MGNNNFFSRVYALVATIPPGRVMTYGQISSVLDSPYSARVVGFAMSAAPDDAALPCHRVVNRRGEYAPPPAFGGPGRQKALLEAEGAPFLPDGRVNLPLALYNPAPEDIPPEHEDNEAAGRTR